jgi:hypothetical protein
MKITFSIFVIGIITIAAFSIYLPFLIEDYDWDEVNAPHVVDNIEESSQGDIKITIEPNNKSGDNFGS